MCIFAWPSPCQSNLVGRLNVTYCPVIFLNRRCLYCLIIVRISFYVTPILTLSSILLLLPMHLSQIPSLPICSSIDQTPFRFLALSELSRSQICHPTYIFWKQSSHAYLIAQRSTTHWLLTHHYSNHNAAWRGNLLREPHSLSKFISLLVVEFRVLVSIPLDCRGCTVDQTK